MGESFVADYARVGTGASGQHGYGAPRGFGDWVRGTLPRDWYSPLGWYSPRDWQSRAPTLPAGGWDGGAGSGP